ncbi:MAG: peptide chain release factor N(5)-glutamine methyltransferase [Synergistaceae bacterium]|jgi:release factor glutamine methyltransferase|nr:peptide chain release factor N(5)-glutamine methyltransferase [Synergistaceae bacterium]
MTLAKIRKLLIESLRVSEAVNSVQEADMFLCRLLNVARASVLGHPEKILTKEESAAVLKALDRRASGEPAQYILGEAHFWGLTFQVGEGVLIPRPETELLVEMALAYLPPSSPSLFLDWGTGSGCVAAALLLERPLARAVLAEKNPLSLWWAWRNLKRHGLLSRGLLWHSREPRDIPVWKNSLDLVVGNPPYIPTGEIPNLMREVREHEPHLALDGGKDGLDCCQALLRFAPLWLKTDGVLILEIGGASQAKRLRNPPSLRLMKETPDYAGIPRCMAWRVSPRFSS